MKESYREDLASSSGLEPYAGHPALDEYSYDGLNRRIEKQVTAGSVDTHYYYNDDWQILEERQVDGAGATTEANQYVWSARYVDSPILRFHDDNGDGDLLDAGDTTRYYTTDANHNVTAVIDAATGTVATYYAYTPYGQPTAHDPNWSNPATPTEDGPLYCGYFFDAESELYQVRNRYYDSSIGAFVSRDPIGYEGGANLYEYVGDNPTNRSDPSGRDWRTNIGFLWDCLTGSGDDVRRYCDGEVQLEEMKNSPGAEKVRRAFYRNCGRDTCNVRYGTGEAFAGTVIGGTYFLDTGDQVGGFGGATATVNPDGTVTFTIPNTAGIHSFFYHICPDRPPGSTGPGRTIQQTFEWTEKIDTLRCILTPRSNVDSIDWGRRRAQ